MGDEAKSLASEARRSRSERDADRLCRTESLQLIPTIKAWWWDSVKAESCFQPYKLQALQRTGAAGISFDHRGSSGAGYAPEPTRLRAGRRHALKRGWWDSEKRQKLLQHIKKSPRSVDTERGNGAPPAGGQFLPVSRGGTSSVVEIKKIPPFG